MSSEIKILVHNIADPNQRVVAEKEMALLLDAGYSIVSTHTDFEMSGTSRVVLLTVIFKK